ncbi:replication protein A 70 kDa DNA-binding subunit C-like protein [Tanacetum coccineum]
MSKSLSVSRNQPELMLNQLELGASGTIVVMICRMCDVNSFTGRYLSTDFIMSDKEPNKEDFRVMRFADFMLEFDGDTRVRKSSVKSVGFNRYPFQFVEIDVLEPTNNKYLIDRLYLSNTSSSLIIDDEKIPVLRRLKHDDSSGLELTKEVMPGDNTLPKPGTLENLLMGQFWCDSCDSAVDYPVLRYSAMGASQARVCFCTPFNLSGSCTELQLQDEDEHSGLPAALANINYYKQCCGGGSNSDMVAAKADSKAPEVKSLNKSLLLSTPSKPTEEKKHRREKLEDSDAEESFVADSQPKEDDVGCSSNTRKKRSKHANLPSLSNILHTSVTIHSNTIVRRDENIQNFCGLKLSDIHTPHTGFRSLFCIQAAAQLHLKCSISKLKPNTSLLLFQSANNGSGDIFAAEQKLYKEADTYCISRNIGASSTSSQINKRSFLELLARVLEQLARDHRKTMLTNGCCHKDTAQDPVKKGRLLNERKQDEIFDPVYDCRKSLNLAAILGQDVGVWKEAVSHHSLIFFAAKMRPAAKILYYSQNDVNEPSNVTLLLMYVKEGGGQPPHGLLNRAIDNSFGSLEKIIAKMNTEGTVVQGTGNMFHIGSYQGCTKMEFCRTEYEKSVEIHLLEVNKNQNGKKLQQETKSTISDDGGDRVMMVVVMVDSDDVE